VAHGLINYYSFVNNYATFRARVLFILRYSCALTLCSKLRLGTISKTFRKFGVDLAIRDGKGEIIKSFSDKAFPRSATGFKTSVQNPEVALVTANKMVPRSRRLFKHTPCFACGSDEEIEMHHLKHLRKVGEAPPKDYLSTIMRNMNRKQIPLCSTCHHLVHSGEYNQTKLNKLIDRNSPSATRREGAK